MPQVTVLVQRKLWVFASTFGIICSPAIGYMSHRGAWKLVSDGTRRCNAAASTRHHKADMGSGHQLCQCPILVPVLERTKLLHTHDGLC